MLKTKMSLSGLLFVSLLFIFTVPSALAMKNQLAGHASPYLAMHGHDPVAWQEWNAATVAQARKQNKLLFVSSGYFSCHWCHVMQRESYQNKAIADILNNYFIPVKVDRELHSALDSHLIDFVEQTQGAAGWPLNVFVTPQGYPLVGMTYVPPDNFKKILELLHEQWTDGSAKMTALAKAAGDELSRAEVSDSATLNKDLADGLMDSLVNQSFGYNDDMLGGFGQENKFPAVPKLDALLAIYRHRPNQQIKQFLETTLNQMASQGLWDQLGGGFYRYTVDPQWQVPHFEKMLYDNALLASLYYRAAEQFNVPHYREIADQTLDFILHTLNTKTAAFAASLSAVDDKGIEGGYYLWDKAQLQKILTKDEFAVAARYWGIDDNPDLDHGHHLVQTMSLADLATQTKRPPAELNALLASAGKKMLEVRARRHLPKDEKILTAWNGLTLSAFVAGAEQGSSRYRQAAKHLRDFIHDHLWDTTKQSLRKATAQQGGLGDGGLEDYAYVAEGLFNWWQLTADPADRQWLEAILNQAWQRFYTQHGWILAEGMLLKYGAGQTIVADGALPSASATLIETTYRYAQLTGNSKLKDRALRAMNVGYEQLQSSSFFYASQIKAIMSAQLTAKNKNQSANDIGRLMTSKSN